jgi:predicted phosphoadenosine phosphosulfate sulfurtransferase
MNLVLEVTIPMLPPSVNKIYAPMIVRGRKGAKGYQSIMLTKEATDWIQQATLFLPPAKLSDNQTYRMEIDLYSNWFTKEGKPKIKDCRNFEKLITDTVFRRYGLNDCWIWESLVQKVQSPEKDRIVVRLFEI